MPAKTNFGKRTPEQHCADAAAAREFHQIQKFVAACRRQWPGAIIVLRPDGALVGAIALTTTKPAPGEHDDYFRRRP
jgi:hypothetical protein